SLFSMRRAPRDEFVTRLLNPFQGPVQRELRIRQRHAGDPKFARLAARCRCLGISGRGGWCRDGRQKHRTAERRKGSLQQRSPIAVKNGSFVFAFHEGIPFSRGAIRSETNTRLVGPKWPPRWKSAIMPGRNEISCNCV